jgi:hypothetical protein
VSSQQHKHARIMIECGCSVEDVAITFRWAIPHALYVVAPALKSNEAAARYARRHYGCAKRVAKMPALHSRLRLVDSVTAEASNKRKAA